MGTFVNKAVNKNRAERTVAMDVELIEDEAQDALQITEEEILEPVGGEKDNSADVVTKPGHDSGLKIILPLKRIPDQTVEWLDESDDSEAWSENESWSSLEAGEEITPKKILDKKTENDVKKPGKVDSDRDDPAEKTVATDEAATSTALAGKLAKSKLTSKQSLANALLKAAKTNARENHYLALLKQNRKTDMVRNFMKGPDKIEKKRCPITVTPQKLKFLRPSEIPKPSAGRGTVASKTKQEETIAKLQNFTKHSTELTVRKLGASNLGEITKISMPGKIIRIQPQEISSEPRSKIDSTKLSSAKRHSTNIEVRSKVPRDSDPGPSTSGHSPNLPEVYRPPFNRFTKMTIKNDSFKLMYKGSVKPDLSPRVPVSAKLKKPESFLECYLRSREAQGLSIEMPRKIVKPVKVIGPLDEPAPSRIRVKPNTELFNNTASFNEELFTADPDSPPLELETPVTEGRSNIYQAKASTMKSPREETPEPEKYVIPQDMLMSSTEKVKVVERKPEEQPASISADYNFADMFVMEPDLEEEKRAPSSSAVASTQQRHKRKSSIVPKDDDCIEFNSKPVDPSSAPRPQENIDLIENLASYRVLVSALLKKLGMPPIDFNEDSNDYINIYKIYRN